MRNTRSSALRNRLLDSSDKEKLSDPQAIYYMRRLWYIVPEETRESCVYVDPHWMIKFNEQKQGRNLVIKWFDRLEIFRRKYILFPLCLSNHWSLVILCNPGGDIKKKSERPSMILLDSLDGALKRDVEELMYRLLPMLYKKTECSSNAASNIQLRVPKIPVQRDDKKCGFFMLYYMTLFLKMFPARFSSNTGYPNFLNRDWFSIEEIDSFHGRLLAIFNRLDDYTVPITMSTSADGVNNDKDTISLIKSCFGEQDVERLETSFDDVNIETNIETSMDTSLFGSSKRQLTDSSESDGIMECNIITKRKKRKVTDGEVTSTARRMYSSGHQKLLMKIQPTVYNKVLDNLTTSQQEWIKTTGFGDLLSFRMPTYPVRLGYNLVRNFDAVMCFMAIGGRGYAITEEDIQKILGLPRGDLKVEFNRDVDANKVWRRQYDVKNKHFRVSIRDVADKIINSDIADMNFKLNFLCLMVTMLIENPLNSFIRQSVLAFSGNIDRCSDYNWCELLINSLRAAQQIWLRNPQTHHYSGSFPFLLYYFLDRALPTKLFEESYTPKYKNWNGFSMKKIECYLMKSNLLSGGSLQMIKVDKDILNSWKNEEEVLNDNKQHITESHFIENVVEVETEKRGSHSVSHHSEDVLKNLEAIYEEYDVIRDKFIENLGKASQSHKKDERAIILKNKFVDTNNVANWLAETHFDNPLANLYVEKVNLTQNARREVTRKNAE